MYRRMLGLTLALAAFVQLVGIHSLVAQGPRLARPQIWADCELFDGVVTLATFVPVLGNFEELYAGGAGFLDRVPVISESKPGDQDYNGGRWHLNILNPFVNPAKYQDACSVEELDLDDFIPMDVYFECPLLPRRGQNP